MKTWIDTYPKALKEHVCSACSRIIAPGETYRRSAGLGDGGAHTWKECLHCSAMFVLADVNRYGADEYTATDFDELEYRDLTELRWVVQWRRKWRRRDGELYPVPGAAS